jgi:hypothetical protein
MKGSQPVVTVGMNPVPAGPNAARLATLEAAVNRRNETRVKKSLASAVQAVHTSTSNTDVQNSMRIQEYHLRELRDDVNYVIT